MISVKVSTKNQIAVPSEARRRLGIQPGDRLDVEVTGDGMFLRKRPARASDRVRGLGRGMYPPDPVTYVRNLRREWETHALDREALVARTPDRRPSTDRP